MNIKNIPIQNIYYMLSYAFRSLSENKYSLLEAEEFKNANDLYAAILIRGISSQLKRGMAKEYINNTEAICSLRGRIVVSETIKTNYLLKKQAICSYDIYSENSYMNKIIKTTMMSLIYSDINTIRKKELRRLLLFFDGIDIIDIHTINWKIRFDRNNQTYKLLISICKLIIDNMIQTENKGSGRYMEYKDDQKLYHLYERFIYEYYKKNYPQITVSSPQIKWALDEDAKGLLPIMQSDVVLEYKKRILIIDAKFYSEILQSNLNSQTIRSNHLYQIFTYVKNKSYEPKYRNFAVSGILLYAKTNEPVILNEEYRMSGNRIGIRTLDLNCSFEEIEQQMNNIVRDYLFNEQNVLENVCQN